MNLELALTFARTGLGAGVAACRLAAKKTEDANKKKKLEQAAKALEAAIAAIDAVTQTL